MAMAVNFLYGNFNSRFKRPPHRRGPKPFDRQQREARHSRYEAAFKRLGVTHRQIDEEICLKKGQSHNYFHGLAIIPSTMLDAIERLTPADFPEGRIDRRKIRSGPQDQARAEDMKARLLAGDTLESIGHSHGVTRERVRQIIVRLGVVNPRHAIAEANRAAKQAELDRKLAARAAKKAALDVRLQKARELVEQGMSVRKAMMAQGFKPNNNYYTCGWPSQHGRWSPELAAKR